MGVGPLWQNGLPTRFSHSSMLYLGKPSTIAFPEKPSGGYAPLRDGDDFLLIRLMESVWFVLTAVSLRTLIRFFAVLGILSQMMKQIRRQQ